MKKVSNLNKDSFNTFNGKSYRFISFKGLENTINNESLRYSRIDSFNDPLDCSPYLSPNFIGQKPIPDRFLKNWRDKNFMKYFGRMYVCCFCKEYNSLDSYLMWSHYSEKHTQACFEIDFSTNNYNGNPSEVLYPDDLCKKRELMKTRNAHDFGIYYMTTKLNIWKYEKEVRLIYDKSYKKHIVNKIFNCDKKHVCLPFDPKIITKIIFGYNANADDEKKIISLVKKKGMQVVFEKMIIDPSDIKLKAIPYDDYHKFLLS